MIRKIIRACFSAGYSVCINTGVVINKKGKPLQGCVMKNGYRAMSLYIAGITPPRGVQVNQHQLVAYAKFGEAMFAEGIEVRHLDGVRLNNAPDNIAIGTRSENMMDMSPEARSARVKGFPSKKRMANDLAVMEIRKLYAVGIGRGDCRDLADKYGLSKSTVSEIGRGVSYATR